MQTILIKYGGNAIENDENLFEFAKVIKEISQNGYRCIIVHGGGPQIDYWLRKLNLESHFIAGQRHTSKESLTAIEMVLCANVNKAIVRALLQQQLPAVGISGEDGAMLRGEKNATLGHAGKILSCEAGLINHLLNGNLLPVIAPLALDENNYPLNVNADFSAAHFAAALKVQQFVLMSNVDGILDSAQQRIARINCAQIAAMIESEEIYGGMLPKIECALYALQHGCKKVLLINGTKPDSLLQAWQQPISVGTEIVL